ncbi:MAG: inorganic diphosphatase [Candidatus Pacebacteria bacterium]|nr:inorganic diphosphatase [Candidatus Paceibacterota bacterium]
MKPEFPEIIEVLIEIPKGENKKYEYDMESKSIKLEKVLDYRLGFPLDYGFIPETLAGDGECLDILVINEDRIAPGTIVKTRPIGVMEMSDDNGVDDKLLGVNIDSKIESIEDLDHKELERITNFFGLYKELENPSIEIRGWQSKERAIELIEKGREAFKKIPSAYLMSSIKEAEEEIRNGEVYSFKNNKEALSFIDKIGKKRTS